MTSALQRVLATALCVVVLPTASLFASAIADDFDSLPVGTTLKVGRTDVGGAKDGWLSPWRLSGSNVESSRTLATIADTTPLSSRGRYFSVAVTGKSGAASDAYVGGSLSRAYDMNAASGGAGLYEITFSFRADSPAGLLPRLRHDLFDAQSRASGFGSTSAWVLSIYNNKWHASNGTVFVDTGMTFSGGIAYTVTIRENPMALRWDLVISDGTRSATLKDLSFRTTDWATDTATTGARWLSFAVSEITSGQTSAGLAATFSADSVVIGPSTGLPAAP
jgi:hypothetical protein